MLFLPASNPRAIAKAREAGADLVVLDLEDAVKPADKGSARDAAVAAVASDWRDARRDPGKRSGHANGIRSTLMQLRVPRPIWWWCPARFPHIWFTVSRKR